MTDHSITGKTVLIAGGAKNLGGLLAVDLARHGARAVAIHYNAAATRPQQSMGCLSSSTTFWAANTSRITSSKYDEHTAEHIPHKETSISETSSENSRNEVFGKTLQSTVPPPSEHTPDKRTTAANPTMENSRIVSSKSERDAIAAITDSIPSTPDRSK